MTFKADQQTLDDLNLLGRYKLNSIASIFTNVKTIGGQKLLDTMFKYPLTDPIQINNRSNVFKYFHNYEIPYPWDAKLMDLVENYFSLPAASNFLSVGISTVRKKMDTAFLNAPSFTIIEEGINSTIQMLSILAEFMSLPWAQSDQIATSFAELKSIKYILAQKDIKYLREFNQRERFGILKVMRFDHLLRTVLRDEMQRMLNFIYAIDVYISVAAIARQKHFCYATAYQQEKNIFQANGLFHPGLNNAVGNSVLLSQQENVLFLTGANMAGKSTFMKSLGIAVYMAHMGFPIAATAMEFSVKNGLYTSINVPDNLNLGLSHFYAEVLRLKKVAEEVIELKNLVIIFDELFKGTNVKDAFDATLAVTRAFSNYKSSFFLISTHIIEAGEALQDAKNIQFKFLPTAFNGNIPKYTYRLQKGLSNDRQGMTIIENEGIIKLLIGNN